jgi:hypothetical protein
MPVPPKLIPRQWLIPKGPSRERIADQVRTFVAALDLDKGWRVTVEDMRPTRSHQQNAYLWGVCYKALADATGYETDEIHEYCCGLMWGWKDHKVPKTPRNPEGVESVPVRSTTRDAEGKARTLNKQEFSDYIARIQRFAASRGVHIPDPEEQSQVAA